MALDIDRPPRRPILSMGLRTLGTAALICLRLMILCSAAVGAVPDELQKGEAKKEEIRKIIAEETAKNGRVPLSLALAVAKVESDLRPDAVSGAGARGVMQIMPATAMSEFGVPASALADPRLNVRLGIAYLERLHNRYGDWELALSHYNGGSLPAAAGQYVAHDYTRQYVADVMKWDAAYRSDATPVPVQTAVAQTAPDTAPSAAAPPEAPAVPTQVASAEPMTRARETVAAESAYPPIEELRARFRASLDRTSLDRTSLDRASADRMGRPAAPVQAADSGAASMTASAMPARSGRFNYGPYGG